MDVTETVTLTGIVDGYREDLRSLESTYIEFRDLAEDKWGVEPEWPDQVQAYEEGYQSTARSLQKRIRVLEYFADEWESEAFEFRMLLGEETMAIEGALSREAADSSPAELEASRNKQVINESCVDAPDEIPRDEDGNPLPSQTPNAVTQSLFEVVERLNSAGPGDFRASGLGSEGPLGGGEPSEMLHSSGGSSSESAGNHIEDLPAGGANPEETPDLGLSDS